MDASLLGPAGLLLLLVLASFGMVELVRELKNARSRRSA
jgi:hypothetical protein